MDSFKLLELLEKKDLHELMDKLQDEALEIHIREASQDFRIDLLTLFDVLGGTCMKERYIDALGRFEAIEGMFDKGAVSNDVVRFLLMPQAFENEAYSTTQMVARYLLGLPIDIDFEKYLSGDLRPSHYALSYGDGVIDAVMHIGIEKSVETMDFLSGNNGTEELFGIFFETLTFEKVRIHFEFIRANLHRIRRKTTESLATFLLEGLGTSDEDIRNEHALLLGEIVARKDFSLDYYMNLITEPDSSIIGAERGFVRSSAGSFIIGYLGNISFDGFTDRFVNFFEKYIAKTDRAMAYGIIRSLPFHSLGIHQMRIVLEYLMESGELMSFKVMEEVLYKNY